MARDALLDKVSDTLSREYPDPAMITSRVEMSLWLSALDGLEGRLLLLGVMKGMDPHHKTRSVQMVRLKSEQPAMTCLHLKQAKLMIEQAMLQFASKKTVQPIDFSWREILVDLLKFKAGLTQDPGLKKILQACHDNLNADDNVDISVLESLSVLPGSSEKRRQWYMYYGHYVAILKIVRLNAAILQNMKFQKSWLEDDENMMVLLYAYAINAGKLSANKSRLQLESERLLEMHPALKPIHHAMKVFTQ